MRKRTIPLLVLVAACVRSERTPPAPTPSSTPSSVATVSLEAAAPALPPESKSSWRYVPKAENGFSLVLDGLCSQLGMGRVGKDVVVHYGGGSLLQGQREGVASFLALGDAGLVDIGSPIVARPTGIAGASLEDFWLADSTGSRTSEGAEIHRRTKGVWKKYPKDMTDLHAWTDGGIIGSQGLSADGLWVEGSKTKPPAALWQDLRPWRISAFPSGEVILFGVAQDNKSILARSWSPGKSVKEERVPGLDVDYKGRLDLLEVAPDEVWASYGPALARWDGKAWRAIGAMASKQTILTTKRASDGDVWVLGDGGAVEHTTPKGLAAITMPEPILSFDGLDRGAVWAAGKSGKLYRRNGEAFEAQAMPKPAFTVAASFKAKEVLVASTDDVLVIGMYWEKGLGWKDQELHTALMRTRAAKETLRCNEPDPENNRIYLGRGFQSWPPMATAECASPFVVIARRSQAIKSAPDWPHVRAALKGHTELGEIALVDFVSGDRTFVGAKAKDFDTAKKLVDVVTAKDTLRPEIVCGEPTTVKQTLAIDLTTGQTK
jgi:hypothetical protein